jgi:hypothetical protein
MYRVPDVRQLLSRDGRRRTSPRRLRKPLAGMLAAVRARDKAADQDQAWKATEMTTAPWSPTLALLMFLAFGVVMVIIAIFRDLTEPPEPPPLT